MKTTQPMPRISHSIFDNKAGRAVRRVLGIVDGAGNATVAQSGNEAEQQHGLQAGNEPVDQRVEDYGSRAGLSNGQHDGLQPVRNDGFHTGMNNGFQAGGHAGEHPGNEDGPDYGFHIGRVGDTLVELEPGAAVPPDAGEHARLFLLWLQGADAAGNWIRRALLEKLYAGPFIDTIQEPAKAWQTVARHFRKLSGVRVRQKDLRVGEYREDGPSTATDYWIPKRSAPVVRLAERREVSR